jgi:hypothetical protein
MRQRLTAQSVYTAMREEWDALRIRHHPVIGIYVARYPGYMIAPWEDRQGRPPFPAEPDGTLERTADGRLILHRDGFKPLHLEGERPGGALGLEGKCRPSSIVTSAARRIRRRRRR